MLSGQLGTPAGVEEELGGGWATVGRIKGGSNCDSNYLGTARLGAHPLGVPNWPAIDAQLASQLGMVDREVEKMLTNINAYLVYIYFRADM